MPPAGFKRSRALWDHARRPHPTKREQWTCFARAVLYEIQPFRVGDVHVALWKGRASSISQDLRNLLTKSVPSWSRSGVTFAQSMTWRQWGLLLVFLAYYGFVRLAHELLDAGPIVVIVTLLIGIFTVGLSDEKTDGLSAYSVFNRGFQRIMGSVDAEELLAQHVGGGMVGAVGNGGRQRAAQEADDVPPRNQRRVAAARQVQADDEEIINNGDLGDNDNAAGQSRKSGKKARRRNHEQRRDQRDEIQRQREAAQAMGFGGNNEAMAMNQLIEDQAVQH